MSFSNKYEISWAALLFFIIVTICVFGYLISSIGISWSYIFGFIGVSGLVLSVYFQFINKSDNDIFRKEVKKDFNRQTREFKAIIRTSKSDSLFEDWDLSKYCKYDKKEFENWLEGKSLTKHC